MSEGLVGQSYARKPASEGMLKAAAPPRWRLARDRHGRKQKLGTCALPSCDCDGRGRTVLPEDLATGGAAAIGPSLNEAMWTG